MTKIHVQGREVFVRPAKAREMLDIEEAHEKPRDVNRHVMAACLVDGNGASVFTPAEIEDLPTPEYRKALGAVWKANNAGDDAKKD